MYLVIRIRGTTGVKQGIASTLEMLRLNRISHAVLVDENPSYKGMLQKAKDYITWGEVDLETLTELVEKRGKEVIRITDFPASSIFDDIEVCPQSLQVSDAIFVIRHIPKHLNKISYFPLSIPEIEISSEIYSKILKFYFFRNSMLITLLFLFGRRV